MTFTPGMGVPSVLDVIFPVILRSSLTVLTTVADGPDFTLEVVVL
ncbi:hypothetical protein GCM10027275_21930 [Rhabdobacter roseus]